MIKRKPIIVGLIFIPIVVFYVLLARETVNLPLLDDYTGALGFLSEWVRIGTVHERIVDALTAQHNEYKLIFANMLFVLQYLIAGKLNFAVLSTIGNLLLLPLFAIIYAIWRQAQNVSGQSLVCFVPVSWLLFQFQYYSLLNWPMSSLQHIAVILFSLYAIYLLSKDELRFFCVSLIALAFAIASSGNGFFVIPVGCLMLLQSRRFKWLSCWLLASAAIFWMYLYKYDFYRSQAHADHSIVSSLHHLSPTYSLAFLGASIARYGFYLPSAFLGVCICGVFLVAIADKLYLRRPGLFYSMLFILFTSIAVSGLRSDLGIAQSLVSRYRIYSNLMLIFIYLYLLGKFQGHLRNRFKQLSLAAAIGVTVVGFNSASNYAGFRLLRTRTQLTEEGMRRWEHGEGPITTSEGPENEDPITKRQRLNGNFEVQDQELREAIALRIYQPPAL